ncbi:MAG: 50S ribosomal protein L11 methyltransferase [Kordiimonas sp.]|nr:50S ribosomal protein L11 methyltransferase [Kordiimonas sp.]
MTTGWKLSLRVPDTLAASLCDELLNSADYENSPSLSDFEIEDQPGYRLIEAYYTHAPVEAHIAKIITDTARAIDTKSPDYELAPLPDLNWVTESQKQLQPVHTAGFYVHGSHDSHSIPATSIPLLIEAGMAFGTGQHETTRGCLMAITDLKRRILPRRCLDVGTGTAVLAMAMAKLWKCPVLATDIDPVATRTAAQNIRVNKLPHRAPYTDLWGIATLTAAGLHHPALIKQAPYDIIVANILASPLKSMAPDLARALAPQGYLILSGLLDHQEAAVLARYRKLGLVLEKRYALNQWRALTLRFMS